MQVSPSLKRSAPSLILASLLVSPAAHAIKGKYLPDEMLPKNVCRIVIGSVATVYTPTFLNNVPRGFPPYIDENQKNVTACSASLVQPNAILTAAHCFQGNNEQHMSRGTILYPKQDKNGVREPGCEGEEWFKKPECVLRTHGSIQERWYNVELECPTTDGGTERRPLDQALGYPNPLFSVDHSVASVSFANYDSVVWRFREPMLKTPVVKVEFDTPRMLAATAKNWQTCKSFGYGRDNKNQSGVLRGAITPIISLTEMMLLADDRAPIRPTPLGVGRTDHGDSGGALQCTGLDGQDWLFGIVSRGGIKKTNPFGGLSDPRFLVGTDGPAAEPEHRSYYSSVAYNAPWIQAVLQSAPLVRPESKEAWYQMILPYVSGEFERNLESAAQCFETNRDKMTRGSIGIYQYGLKKLRDDAAESENKMRADGIAGMHYARLMILINRAKQTQYNCAKGSNFDH